VGGWLTLQKFGSGPSTDALTLALLCVTPVTAGLLGLAVGRGCRRWKMFALLLPVLVVAAGAINGLAILLVASAFDQGHIAEALVPAILFGGFCGLFFIPAMLWTFLAGVRVDGVRAGSLLFRVYRRAPWVAVATSSAVALGACCRREGGASTASSAIVAGLLLFVVAAILAADLRMLWQSGRRAAIATIPVDARRIGAHQGDELDLGIGEELMAEQVPGPSSAYRATGLRVTRLRGSVGEARRRILVAVGTDALATCAALACALQVLAVSAASEGTAGISRYREERVAHVAGRRAEGPRG
jgi:hypothetical protein